MEFDTEDQVLFNVVINLMKTLLHHQFLDMIARKKLICIAGLHLLADMLTITIYRLQYKIVTKLSICPLVALGI